MKAREEKKKKIIRVVCLVMALLMAVSAFSVVITSCAGIV